MATWSFEPGHTEAAFRARHMMVTWVRGLFKDIYGRMARDRDDPLNTTFGGAIDARKLSTGEPDRYAHLRSSDFFATQKELRPSDLGATENGTESVCPPPGAGANNPDGR